MRYTIFGESHGPAIGVVIQDLPSGIALDMEEIAREMARRAPGNSPLATARREKDVPEILSGLFEGQTTGTPLCAMIANTDQHSGDYDDIRRYPRPGHADYTGFMRYQGCADHRGGGHFSGRLTAPLVFAGAVAKQMLAAEGITIGAHIRSIAGIEDLPFANREKPLTPPLLRELNRMAFPVLWTERGEEMQAEILKAKSEGDSVGGTIECAVTGLPAGMGAPDLGENVEGIVSRHVFAVPGVKAIGFGDGFGFAYLRGSQANDSLRMRMGEVVSDTNHSGGINGGITNGLPLVFEVALRPTASIAREQQTVDLENWTNATITVKGRHDPCIVQRAVPVIEAAAALAVCEVMNI